MRARSLLFALAALVAAPAAGCDGPGPSLFVDLKTDLAAGREFYGVRTSVRDADAPEEAPALEAIDRFATPDEDYLLGERVAELTELPAGLYVVSVGLLGPAGEMILSRDTLVRLDEARVVTVLITGSCRDVVCPGSGDETANTACVGGRCVDPRCSVETPEFCGVPSCMGDGQCAASTACVDPRCIDGECFAQAQDARCGANEYCDTLVGCVLRPDGDAGPACPALESSCGDGVDEDCDGAIDCADSDCLDVSCDDESVCTEQDVCRADGTCGGEAVSCDDGEPCTDDVCDAVDGCRHDANTASCDDGFWCNGADTCRDGSCQDHASPPCAAFCNEGSMACEECAGDTDCGAVAYGVWGACDYVGTCDESASQSRSVMTPRCGAGTCTVETTSESRPCTRTTGGDSCGSTTYSAWSACDYSNACDTSANQTRTRTRRLCSAGSCSPTNNTETRGCTRTVATGTGCGSGRVCCSGSCVSITTNSRCGGCNVNCTSFGGTCANNGEGLSCRGCSSNAQCRSLLNSNATCWDLASPPAYCECQCASNGVCANGGCGTGFFCHDCPGHNFCSATGGGC